MDDTSPLLRYINPSANPVSNFPTTSASLVAKVFQLGIASAAAIFLVMLVISGVRYLTSAGGEEGIEKAKKNMLTAIIGLILVLSAYGIGITILRLLGFSL